MPQERLQKILAHAGVASRRHAEALITSGRVRVNSAIVTELGAKADPRQDTIEVDGRRIVAEMPVFVVLHKPKGIVSTVTDPEGRPTVTSLVSQLPVRLYPVGRLDVNTSGALVLTNDGEFTAAMLHPKKQVPKTYLVKVEGQMLPEDVNLWRSGVELDDGKTLPSEVRVVRKESGKTWLEVTLFEGRNRQIRRMGEATRFPVVRLTRLAFAGIGIQGLFAGQWRFLSVEELRDLRETYGVPKRVRAAIAQHEQFAHHVPRPGPRRGASTPDAEQRPSRDKPSRGAARTDRSSASPQRSGPSRAGQGSSSARRGDQQRAPSRREGPQRAEHAPTRQDRPPARPPSKGASARGRPPGR